MNLLQRAFNGANLTPGERAFLKVLQSLALGGLVTGLLAVSDLLTTESGVVDLQKLLGVAVVAVVLSVAHGLAKYASAQGDTPLGAAIEIVTTQAGQRLRPITSNAYMPPAAKQQIAALPTTTPRTVPDYTTMVNPQAPLAPWRDTQYAPPADTQSPDMGG